QITAPPAGQSVTEGGSVTLSVAASGTPAPAYQWRLNGAVIPGATGAALTVDDFQFDNQGSYSVVASNSAGFATSPSAFLALDVPAQLGPVSKSGDGPFQMQLTGTARQNYVIQSTTNLTFTNTVWTSLIVTSSFSGVLDFQDAGATNSPRFYRAVKQ
ncbi:MAG: immunoglobulin domain-containing protein, partial [Verrucomicrobia bacterium]|nr:immunoglobulin domain-containing protein [Verrucomicrobiota bacterium]